MFKYTIKRVLQSLLTVLIVVSIVSLLLSLMPTDYYFTEDELMKLTDEQKNAILSAAGLLDNPFEQLFHFLKNLFLHGDLGVSRRIQAGVPVLTVIGGKFGISMKMGSIALVISLLLGVPMGILQAKYKNGAFDNAGTVYTIFVNAVPSLVSYSLVLVLGVKVFGLPSMYSTRQALRSSIMPVICLALGSIASYALWMRRYMIDELTKDYIKLAKIKGLSSRTIMFRHVLRNAFVPMAQNLPSSFMLTISGSLLVERFFSVPGMGPLLTDAITRYDLNMVRGLVLLYSLLGVFGLFLGDVLMTIFDPRIRLTGKSGDNGLPPILEIQPHETEHFAAARCSVSWGRKRVDSKGCRRENAVFPVRRKPPMWARVNFHAPTSPRHRAHDTYEVYKCALVTKGIIRLPPPRLVFSNTPVLLYSLRCDTESPFPRPPSWFSAPARYFP